jgi:uncharacterized membrane protein YkvI
MQASSPSIDRQEAQQTHLLTPKRTGMAAATAFVTANIWTGCRLLAVWIGSKLVGTKELSMGAVFVNVYVAVISLVLWYVLYAAPPAPTLCTVHC